MRRVIRFVAVLALTIQGAAAVAGDNRVTRGEYLVRFGGCNDCHTPGCSARRADPRADHAVARVRWIDEIRRRRDCRLSQEPAAGQPPGTGAVRIRRQAASPSDDGGLSGR
jgi:hypothetical protein